MIDISKLTDEEFAAMEDALKRRGAEKKPPMGIHELAPAGKTEAKPIDPKPAPPAVLSALEKIDKLWEERDARINAFRELSSKITREWEELRDQVRTEIRRIRGEQLGAILIRGRKDLERILAIEITEQNPEGKPYHQETSWPDELIHGEVVSRDLDLLCSICNLPVVATPNAEKPWTHKSPGKSAETHPLHDAEHAPL